MISFEAFVGQIQKSSDFRLLFAVLKNEWGSQNLNYRLEIRTALLEYLKSAYPYEVSDSILDLNTSPKLKKLNVSISHSQNFGGFIIADRPVGFDLELKSRISSKLVERISTKKELEICPQVEFLWVAKESVFKCLPHYEVISEVHINRWRPSQNGIFQFESDEVTGWTFMDSDHAYAIAVKNN